jgi:uncharacterized membrane protein YjjP (DUF1212 family)
LIHQALLTPPAASDAALKALTASSAARNRWLALCAALLAAILIAVLLRFP